MSGFGVTEDRRGEEVTEDRRWKSGCVEWIRGDRRQEMGVGMY